MDSANHFEVKPLRFGEHGNCKVSIVFTTGNSHAVVTRPGVGGGSTVYLTPEMAINLAAWLYMVSQSADVNAGRMFDHMVKEIEGK